MGQILAIVRSAIVSVRVSDTELVKLSIKFHLNWLRAKARFGAFRLLNEKY